MKVDVLIAIPVNIVNVNNVYLLVFDYELGDLHVYRNIPDNIEDLEEFVSMELGYHLDEVEYMTTEEDNGIYYFTYKDGVIKSDGADYVGQKF
jgi:hypothetical protein